MATSDAGSSRSHRRKSFDDANPRVSPELAQKLVLVPRRHSDDGARSSGQAIRHEVGDGPPRVDGAPRAAGKLSRCLNQLGDPGANPMMPAFNSSHRSSMDMQTGMPSFGWGGGGGERPNPGAPVARHMSELRPVEVSATLDLDNEDSGYTRVSMLGGGWGSGEPVVMEDVVGMMQERGMGVYFAKGGDLHIKQSDVDKLVSDRYASIH